MELADDPANNDAAFASWSKHVIIGVLVGIPVVMALLGLSFVAFAGTDRTDAYIIALWASLWTGVFVGGTAGAMTYAIRHHE